MNASALTKKNRRRKQNKKEDINGRDRSLSDLPDNILSHILSFLPTDEAVRTSILSKRWEYIWTSISELDFDQEDLQEDADPMNFVNIVEKALRLRGSLNITKFSLNCKYETCSHVEEWMSTLVRFNVQDLHLRLDSAPKPLTLPLSFVNCGTLTDFTLNMIDSEVLEFPSSVCFSNLKKLELHFVTFSNEHSTKQLFSGCPVLEDLELNYCRWTHVRNVSVAAPRLQYFTMIDKEIESVDGYEFVIISGGLKSFHYEGLFHFNYNILNSALLEKVYINYYSPINCLRFLTLLRNISNVPNLTLSDASLLFDVPELAIHMPVFTGVRYLGLGYNSSDLSSVVLLNMLRNIPFLESLVFYEGIKISNPTEDGRLDPVPPCFLNRLYFISVHIEHGNAKELEAVKVLLKNAMVLEEMAIEFCGSVKEDIKYKFCLGLLKLPRGSKDSSISVRE